MQLDEGAIQIYSQSQARRRLQERVAHAVPTGVSLANELILERRGKAGRE